MPRNSKPFEFPTLQKYWSVRRRLAAITDAAPRLLLISLLKEKLWEYDRLSALFDYAIKDISARRSPPLAELRESMLQAGVVAVEAAYEALRPAVKAAARQKASLASGRQKGRNASSRRAATDRARAKESAERYLVGRALEPAASVIAHVAGETGLPKGTVRRHLGNLTKLRNELRAAYRRGREARMAKAGGLRG